MKVLVTGGTGFVGKHVVQELLDKGNEVLIAGRKPFDQNLFDSDLALKYRQLNINSYKGELGSIIKEVDKVIHLAWEGLPNYTSVFHIENNLFAQYKFLKSLIEAGMKDITITGTCLEYGLRDGCLRVSMSSDPQNPYAIAKDCLRKFLQQLQFSHSFKLKWVRLFYMYGEGQSEKSLLAQLKAAIKNKDNLFNMSGGEQLRDYLPVEEVAKRIVTLSLDDTAEGIYNCCSGKPLSVRKLVEKFLAENNADIKLNLGHYPYPEYEPMAFWGESNIPL